MLHFVQVMKAMQKRATIIARNTNGFMYNVLGYPKKYHVRVKIFVEFIDHAQDPYL